MPCGTPGENTSQWRHLSVHFHYSDVIMSAMVSHITSFTIVYPIVYSGRDQIKHQSSVSLAFVRRIHRWPVNSPHKWPVTRKMFPFDDVIMSNHRITCFNSLLTTNKQQSSALMPLCEGNPATGDQWIPLTKCPIIRKGFPCHKKWNVSELGHVTWWSLLGLLSRHPPIFFKSL